MSAGDLQQVSAARIAEAVQAREISATELVRASLARIEATDSFVNAFRTRSAQLEYDKILLVVCRLNILQQMQLSNYYRRVMK